MIHLFSHRRSGSRVFALGGRKDRLYTRRQPAVEITGLETGGNLLVNDSLAQRIRQDALQSIAHLQKHFVVLDENEEHGPVVFVLLSHLSSPRHAHGIIFNGRIRLHRRKYRDQNLLGSLTLKIFERLVQLRCRASGDDMSVVVEVGRRCRRNNFIRKQTAAKKQNQDDAEAAHGSMVG